MNLTEAEGSRWETADGKLMLRHANEDDSENENENQKLGAIGELGALG